MTASTFSSAGEPDAIQPDISLEAHELLTQVLPLLVADARAQIAQGARQAAWQQVDHVLDNMGRYLAEQTSDWLDQVSSMFREDLDRTLVTLGAEWCTQIERALDPIRAATFRQVDQAVRATWGDGAAAQAAESRRRAAKETHVDDAELVLGDHARERKATRRARRSSSRASKHAGATAREEGAEETETKEKVLSERDAAKRPTARSRTQTEALESPGHLASTASLPTQTPAKRPSAPPSAEVSGRASGAKRTKEQASQAAVTEKPARRTSSRQSAARSTSGKPAASSPPRRTQARRDSTHMSSGRHSLKGG